jgi:DNA-binding response OmpR family regulator
MKEHGMSTSPTPPRRLLFADDEPAILGPLAAIIGRWNWEVITVSNGKDALEVLRRDDSPRVALLDWNMPGVDGLEVCRIARELRPSEPPYLILLTGRGGREDLIAGLEGGADEYLPKPVDKDELRARLQAAWRLVELQSKLINQVHRLADSPLINEVVGEQNKGLQDTLRLCVAIVSETLTLQGIPRHLRIALRTCRGLCMEAIGDEPGDDLR